MHGRSGRTRTAEGVAHLVFVPLALGGEGGSHSASAPHSRSHAHAHARAPPPPSSWLQGHLVPLPPALTLTLALLGVPAANPPRLHPCLVPKMDPPAFYDITAADGNGGKWQAFNVARSWPGGDCAEMTSDIAEWIEGETDADGQGNHSDSDTDDGTGGKETTGNSASLPRTLTQPATPPLPRILSLTFSTDTVAVEGAARELVEKYFPKLDPEEDYLVCVGRMTVELEE